VKGVKSGYTDVASGQRPVNRSQTKQLQVLRQRHSSTLVEVEVLAKRHLGVICVDVLAPSVEKLMKVVSVVLAAAARRMSSSECSGLGQSAPPAVVCTNTQENVSAIVLNSLGKEAGGRTDIEIRVHTISTRSTAAFLAGDLHQALLATTTDSVGVATALLHGERREHDGRDTELVTILLEHADVFAAGLERTRGRLERSRQGLGDNILHLNIRWLPAGRGLESTVEPVDISVGSR